MKLLLAMSVPLMAAFPLQGNNRVLPPQKSGSAYTEALRGKQWNLATLNGKPAAKGRTALPFILLDRNSNKLVGSGGVNRFMGTYILTGNKISLNPGAMTKMAGTPEQSKQEMEFISALTSANAYKLKAGGLTLFVGTKAVATFTPLVTRL